MKRLLLLALLTLLIAPAHAAGDGCPPQSCGFESVAVPGSPVVALRLSGGYDAYDVATGKQRFSEPYGLESADGRSFFAATNRWRATDVRRVDARTAREEGAWTLGPKLSLSAVAADGSHVLLQRPARVGTSAFLVLDTRNGATHALSLRGMFSAEAVSRDGRRLFLIQYVHAGYRVRVYEVNRGALRPGELKARNESEPMRGYPAYAIGARDGRWLLTLYVKPHQHEAFVHALDLRRAVAYCLDLPGHGSSAEIGVWSLTLGLDGETLYAANGSLGLATRIDLGTLESARPVRFSAPLGADQYVNSALSPRGDLVYFGGLHGLWAYDLRANRVRGPYRPDRIGTFAFTRDGRRLTVITPGGRALWLDAATGRRI
jgi:hypothetical protein